MKASAHTLLVLTNIPTPYRTNFFNRLAEVLDARSVRLVVAYCAQSEWNRHWDFLPGQNRYEYHFLAGRSLRLGTYSFHWNPAIIQLLEKIRPTWLLSAGAWNMPTGLLALTVRWRYEFDAIFWSEGHRDTVLHQTGLIAWARRRVLQRYNAFAVPNQRSADFLRAELHREPACLLLPNTVDDRFYVPPSAEARLEARQSRGIQPAEILLLQVSQLEPHKGVLELCSAARRAFDHHPGFKLAIVGTGTLKAQLAQAYASSIRTGRLVLPGTVSATEVRAWLYAADGFALLSKRDPNPLSSIEAALCGRPLLLSRLVGNASELVQPETTGWIVDEVSETAIAGALDRFLGTSRPRMAEMGRAAHESARASFSTEKVARELTRDLFLRAGLEASRPEGTPFPAKACHRI